MMKKLSRRDLVKFGVVGAVAGLSKATESWSEVIIMPTPEEVEGPFYPVADQIDKDADMTQVTGRSGQALGQYIIIRGAVKDRFGVPVENATIDIWQANAAGRYDHPRDSNRAPVDPYFQGWAVIHSDTNGLFRFKTVKPGAYPASRSWTRPPHIHFKIFKKGYPELITQMYFPNEPLNASDLLFSNKTQEEQKAMVAQKTDEYDGMDVYTYNIVLRGH
ncbi:protocatechuate 3,4-dioxygenase, beta subunit [Nitrosomonas marina]|uniref:Protocatechuate 3,4-dioxygenase, beta subunit n=1 Tax=Nitrosomonas marina TaxID=917 RepID=A0A1H9YCQ1_9PROT|nr:protocatechuate 3,4-dioxygenase [Nitrosomonas marina]SES66637.1 protocatechuate 3,4-dioxygenase, beta subunit [Nitrosomonas marina]